MNLDSIQLDICETQGKLFELANALGFDSDEFVRVFMSSETAEQLDMPWSHAQWAGEKYLMEELMDRPGGIPTAKYTYTDDAMFWMGYIYRYWHFYTGETSAEIYRHIDAKTMAAIYPGYHTLGCEQAIDRIMETRS